MNKLFLTLVLKTYKILITPLSLTLYALSFIRQSCKIYTKCF